MSIRSKDPTFVYLVMCAGWPLFFSMLAVTNLVYQVEVAHLDPLRLLLVGTVLELTCFVFQVPTGLLADAFSRRWAVAVGFGLVGAGFILEGLVPHFTAIAIAQVIWGIGATLSDGADDAWITDEVGVKSAGRLFREGHRSDGQVAGLVGIVVGVGLASIRLNLPIVIGGGLLVLLGVYLFFAMTEAGYRAIPREDRGSLAGMAAGARSSLASVRSRPLILTILAITVVWGLSGEGIDRLYQVHFLKDVGLPSFAGFSPVLWFGLISGGSALIGIATTQVIRLRLDLENHAHVARSLLGFTAVRAVMLAGFARATNLAAAIAFFWVASVHASGLHAGSARLAQSVTRFRQPGHAVLGGWAGRRARADRRRTDPRRRRLRGVDPRRARQQRCSPGLRPSVVRPSPRPGNGSLPPAVSRPGSRA